MAENDTESKELTSAQRKAIPHLLACRSFEEAAKSSGVSERTLYRWFEQPHFKLAVGEAERNAIDYAVRRMATLADKAVEVLREVIEDKAAPKSIRVRAALGLLDQLTRLRELRNLETRLVALEQIYGDAQHH